MTKHAMDQFMERWPEFNPKPPRNYLYTLRRLLQSAKRQPLVGFQGLVRLIKHKCVEADYWVNTGWRFVVVRDSEELVLVTVERIGAPKLLSDAMQGIDSFPCD